MKIVSLIAQPDTLSPELAENLRSAWGGSAITWLSPKRAAEFEVPETPDTFSDVRANIQSLNVDLNILPASNRRKTVLIADMDSTMIQQECIDELARAAGVYDEVAAVTAQAMNGELNFEDAIHHRVNLLKGLPLETLKNVYNTQITFMPGAKTLLATMKANNAYAALVSGGFTYFTQIIAQTLGFDEHRANTLLDDGSQLTGKVATPILGQDAKVAALEEIIASKKLSSDDVIAVGDGANDLPMLKSAGLGVAAHAKPTVQAQADICVNHGDLTALLYLQGYSQSEFIST